MNFMMKIDGTPPVFRVLVILITHIGGRGISFSHYSTRLLHLFRFIRDGSEYDNCEYTCSHNSGDIAQYVF